MAVNSGEGKKIIVRRRERLGREWVHEDGGYSEHRFGCRRYIRVNGGDVNPNGGPVGIAGLDSVLVASHGIQLDVSSSIVHLMSAFPGDDVPDIFIFEATECYALAAFEFKAAPAKRMDVDAIMDACVHWFGLDGSYVSVVDSDGVSPPETVKAVEFPRQYLVTMRVAFGWCVESYGVCGEAVASLRENGHGRLRLTVVVDQHRVGQVVRDASNGLKYDRYYKVNIIIKIRYLVGGDGSRCIRFRRSRQLSGGFHGGVWWLEKG